ncbi:hypothetical protein KEM48_010864 [Puccinia striiformis f. sp. tritici PST-130]|nr:hypothetical protein KEM48_010864 [Puccinia striiformis f. sp. tritici PST-130]
MSSNRTDPFADQPHPELDDEGFPLKEAPSISNMGGFRAEAGGLAPASKSESSSTNNFGFPAPTRQRIDPKRAKTIKVKLQHGHFVNEYPVPLRSKMETWPAAIRAKRLNSRTCAIPQSLATRTISPARLAGRFALKIMADRPNCLSPLLIIIEDKILVARTLHGVMLNLRDMCKAKWSEFRHLAKKRREAATEPWKMISVVLVFDGIEPADKASSCTGHRWALSGWYHEASVSPKPELIQPTPNDPANLVPVQMTLVLKQKNAKKINSHRWLFNAVAAHLQPEEVRDFPFLSPFYFEKLSRFKPIAQVLAAKSMRCWREVKKLLNPLVAAQNFEYKMSSACSSTSFVTFSRNKIQVSSSHSRYPRQASGIVLRVCLSPSRGVLGYRYQAILGRPLQQYFHGDHSLSERLGKKGIQGMGIFKKNMFLAEDRILCFELVAKAKSRWVLGYVKPAKGETDVPEEAAELLIAVSSVVALFDPLIANKGSFAAGIYALAHFSRMYSSGHGFIRMFFLHVQAFYTTAGLVMSWFALGNWFTTFAAIIDIIAENWRDPGITDYNSAPPPSPATTPEQLQAAFRDIAASDHQRVLPVIRSLEASEGVGSIFAGIMGTFGIYIVSSIL